MMISGTIRYLLVWASCLIIIVESGASNEYVFSLIEPQSDEITSSTPYLLIASPSEEPVVVSINIEGINFNREATISPSEGYANITLPTTVYLRDSAKQNKAIRISSQSRIFVYGAYIYDDYRASGFSVFPVSELGRTYYVASYTPDSGEYSEYSITALDAQITNVEITTDSTTRSISLQPYESYQYKSSSDLTGTKITADQPISVMSGASGAHVESQSGGPEYMIEHIPPVKNLGTTYILSPFQRRSSGYVFRVIATEEGTSVTFNDNQTPVETLRRPGDIINKVIQQSSDPYSIVADKPVMVVQYAGSHHTDTYGDTFMLIAAPIRPAVKEDISFPITTLRAATTVNSYIHITLNCLDIDAIRVDGESVQFPSSWTKLADVPIGSTTYCVVQREYPHGAHHITTPDRNVPYEATVYGFSQKYVAYAFTLWGLSQERSSELQDLQNSDATTISCEDSQMVVLLNSSYVMNGAAQEVHLLDPSCIGQSFVNNTIRLVTDFDKCGTSMTVEDDSLVFTNKLIYKAPRPQTNTVPQYFSLSIILTCTVPRRGNSSFGPMYGPIKGGESGSGHLKFSLDMYQDDQFTDAYDRDDFPIMIDEGEQIYLAASVNDVVEVTVSIEVCKVTPTRNPDDEMQRIILENGCGIYHPITFYESQDDSQLRFSTPIDGYFSVNPMMFIHCSMIVCSSNNTELCPQTNTNCPATRPVRDVRSASSLTRVTVSTTGPVVIRTASHLTNNKPNRSSVILVVVGVLSLSLVAFILLIVILKKFYTRYHTSYSRLNEEFEMGSVDENYGGKNFKYAKFNNE